MREYLHRDEICQIRNCLVGRDLRVFQKGISVSPRLSTVPPVTIQEQGGNDSESAHHNASSNHGQHLLGFWWRVERQPQEEHREQNERRKHKTTKVKGRQEPKKGQDTSRLHPFGATEKLPKARHLEPSAPPDSSGDGRGGGSRVYCWRSLTN